MSEIESTTLAEAGAHPPLRARGDLTQGPVTRTMLVFTLPTLGSNILQSLNGSVSAIYVGKLLGEQAFAAAGISAMVIFVIFSTVLGLSMAATILVGQAMGRRDLLGVKQTVGATTGTFVAIGLAIAVFGHLLVPPILRLLTTPAAAFGQAVDFLQVVFIGMPVVLVLVLVQSAMRGVGDAVSPLYSTLLNVLLSLVLNPLLILGLGPIPALGLRGAALAGVIANLCCVIFLVARAYALDLPIALRGRDLRLLRPDWAHLRPVLAIGVPTGLSMIIMSTSTLLMVGLINREGVQTVAAYSAATQLWAYIQMPAFAVGSAASAMAAQNIGAGRWDRVAMVTRTGVVTNVIMTGILIVLLVLFDHWLLALFLPAGSPAIAIGEHIDMLVGWTYVAVGISMVINSVVRANGAVLVPLLFLVLSLIGIRLGIGFGFYPRFGAEAIWWAFIASSSASALFAVLYYLSGSWRGQGRKVRPPLEATA